MRHVNEPPPSVLDRRPDCPIRLDLAIQRAMAKDPEERYGSMEEFCTELEGCLNELNGRGDEVATMIVPPPPMTRRAKKPRQRLRVPWTPILLVLVAALLVAGGAYLLLHGGGSTPILAQGASPKPVHLQGAGAFDPFGTGAAGEHDSAAPNATDGNRETFWDTEDYDNFQKAGVGLVLKAPKPTALAKLTVNSVGTSFDAQVKGGGSPAGPFTDLTGDFQPVGASKTFGIDTHDKKYLYYMVWLKLPFEGGQAKISEVTAKT
jgi:hypothetical protein